MSNLAALRSPSSTSMSQACVAGAAAAAVVTVVSTHVVERSGEAASATVSGEEGGFRGEAEMIASSSSSCSSGWASVPALA